MGQYDSLNPDVIYFMHSTKTSKWHTHELLDFYAILFILSGQAEFQVGTDEFVGSAGQAIILKPGEERFVYSNDMHYVALDFQLPPGQSIDLPRFIKVHNPDIYMPYFDELNVSWVNRGFEYKLECKALTLLILQKLLQEENNKPINPKIAQIKNYIVKNYHNPITVADISEQLQMNPVYCGALFKKYLNCSIPYYINRIRIQQAITLMENTNLSISEIAYQVGFNDIYYFSKTFKKHKNLSPSDYKRYHVHKIE